MKKHLLHLFLLLVALSVSPTIHADVTFTVDGINYVYNSSLDYVEVGNNRAFVGDAVIPDSVVYNSIKYGIKKYGIEIIGNEAFKNCSNLTSIKLPEKLRYISENAFSGCTGLTSISLPASLEGIMEYGFLGCTGLNSVSIPDSVSIIWSHSFSGCTGLTTVSLPASLTKIKESAFSGCTGLTTVSLPASLTKIEESAFSGCTGLTTVSLPASLTEIEESAFSGCTGLAYMKISCPLKSLYKNFFSDIRSIKTLEILAPWTSINDKQFDLFTNLTTITLPESISSIGNSAFRYCSSLTSVTLPNSLVNIGDNAFYCCGALTSITLPESLTTLGLSAFAGCKSLSSVRFLGTLGFLPEEVFNGCSSLNTIEFPDMLTAIGNRAFKDCKSLTSVALPISIQNIGASAFEGCTKLASIKLPDSLTAIGASAFEDCIGLKSIILPQSLSIIRNSTFYGCPFSKIVIPPSVREIEVGSLYGAREIHFDDADGPIRVAPGFFSPEAIRRAYMGRRIDTEYDYYGKKHKIIKWPEALEEITFGPKVSSIAYMAFEGCKNLKKVLIPESVEYVIKESFTEDDGRIFYGAKCDSLIVKAVLAPVYLKKLSDHLSGNIITNIQNVYWDSARQMFKLSNNLDKDKERFSLSLYDLSVEIRDFKGFLKGFSFKIVPNPYWDKSETSETVFSAGEGWTLPSPDADGVYFAKGLDIRAGYDLVLKYKDMEMNQHERSISFFTRSPYANIEKSSTQSTVTISSMSVLEDITCKPDGKMGVKYTHWDSGTETDVTEETEYKGKELTLTNFPPDYNVGLHPYAYYDGKRYDLDSQTVKTKPLNPVVKVVKTGPTSVEVEGSYIEGDANISWMGFNDWRGTQGYPGKTATITGQIPETENYVNFRIISCGRDYASKDVKFKTAPLSFTTLAPKCVSSTCAIVAAETNISEMETNAGFQWKKYDAPESLKPSEGYAAIYDGMLEGYIKNLQSTSYYSVRPFYKDAKDKYYYGEWVTFDPSDFSYFEPTVHTYPVEEVDGTSATMRGYVLGGTDEITGQGFEYWELGGRESQRRNAPSAGIMSVEGFGQVMRVVVDGLKEGTRYGFRTYVQTIAGKTYGEEQTFTTTGTVGVDEITDDAVPEPVGYFDLCGRRYNVPQQGLNIVVYSDGTSRKFIRK